MIITQDAADRMSPHILLVSIIAWAVLFAFAVAIVGWSSRLLGRLWRRVRFGSSASLWDPSGRAEIRRWGRDG